MGHRVVLLTTDFPGAPSRENVDGIEVVRKGGDLLFQWTVARSIRKLHREFRFDLVVEDLNKLPVFPQLYLKVPVVVQMHHLWLGSIFAEAKFPVALGVWLFERSIPFFYRREPFIVVSPSTEKELRQIGVCEKRISVIYNGSEPASIEDGACGCAERPYFLWISRIHRYKGIWTALEAFSSFSKKHPSVDLVIAGDGPLLKKLPSWIKKRGLENRVRLMGFVPAEEKRRLMSGALALLQTSFKEGWGLTVMEAAQLKVPTIASDVPGLRDSVRHGRTGILFPAGDALKCAEAMACVYLDSDLRRSMGWAAKQYAASFSWDDAAAKTMEILVKAAEGKGNEKCS